VQAHRYDGPWTDVSEDLQRDNLLLRYSADGRNGGTWDITAMAYAAEWNAADQIPRRAVDAGLLAPFGSIDTTLGGDTSRYSLSGAWSGELGGGRARLNAYAIRYDLALFSNFTYWLDDPDAGDQFEQRDRRTIGGGDFAYSFGSRASTLHTLGAMLRYDDIDEVGLYRTAARERHGTVRRDAVEQRSIGVYYSAETRWSDRVRTVLGVRADHYDFDVESDLPANSGRASDSTAAPKASVIYTLGAATELYASAGAAFHSNDARGTTITIDPATGEPAERVSPLVDSRQLEVGFRSFVDRRVNVSASLWYLELDSELLFIGDAGSTEASLPSRRYGLEIPLYYRPSERLTFDVELAWTDSRFEGAGDDDRIPGAIDRVVSAGVSFRGPSGLFGSARARYFGPRPLVEDGSVESESSTVVNLSLGVERPRYEVRLDVLNALDSRDDDITYFYASRLPGEPAGGVEDVHFHPIEPRTARLYVAWKL